MKHANQGANVNQMGPGPYHFQMPKSARGLNSNKAGEHNGQKNEPKHFNFRNLDDEILDDQENELGEEIEGDSAISSEDDKQENVNSSQKDIISIVKSKQAHQLKNKINLSCFPHQFPSKKSQQRVSFMDKISEQLDENPNEVQILHQSPVSGSQTPDKRPKHPSAAPRNTAEMSKTVIWNPDMPIKHRKANHISDLTFVPQNSKEQPKKNKKEKQQRRQEGQKAKQVESADKETATGLRQANCQGDVPLSLNNKHNSVLDIQPLGNVEAVDPMEDAGNISMPPSEQGQEREILENLPPNGCSCNRDQGIKSEGTHQKKGCINTSKWLKMAYEEENYFHLSSYKLYQGFLTLSRNINSGDEEDQIEQDIQQDLERTFQHLEYFRRPAVKQSLRRILVAFSNYETNVGYVQGMNFIAAVLIVHTGEVAAFWLLCALMEKYELKKVLSHGLTGLQHHEEQIELLGRRQLPRLFEHFDKTYVSVSLFSTDWIISVFMNFIPIELTHIYLDLFFERSWNVFYQVALALLGYYEKTLLRLRDAGQIVGQIKQARLGCEHLLMLSSQPSLQSSKNKAMMDPSRASAPYDLQKITERSDSEYDMRQSSISGIPFSVINLLPQDIDVHNYPENFKDTSILEDSQSEIMVQEANKSLQRSQSMVPQNSFALNFNKDNKDDNDAETVLTRQMSQSYIQNPLFVENMRMWKQIIDQVQQLNLNE